MSIIIEPISTMRYNEAHSGLACRMKGGKTMASQTMVKGYLVDDKGAWTVRARFPDTPGGKPKLHSKSTGLKVSGNNKRRAEAAMREIVAQWERQLKQKAPIDQDATFDDCVQSWLRMKEPNIRRDTIEGYKLHYKKHIKPVLGGIKLRDLTRQNIQEYFNSLAGVISPNSMRKHNVIIHGALKKAVLDGVLTSDVGNVLREIELPKKRKYEGKCLSDEQIKVVSQKLVDEPEPIRAAVTLGLCYGLRRSEMCGLRWQDVDFENSILHVRNTVIDCNGELIEEEQTKTDSSRRDITLVESTRTYLQALYDHRAAQGMKSDKVCAYEDGRAVKPDYISRHIKDFLERCGAPNMRLHDLRHTAATVLVKRMPVIYVTAFLGHNQVSTTTDIYSHVLEGERQKASATMDAYLESLGFCSESCSETDKNAGVN